MFSNCACFSNTGIYSHRRQLHLHYLSLSEFSIRYRNRFFSLFFICPCCRIFWSGWRYRTSSKMIWTLKFLLLMFVAESVLSCTNEIPNPVFDCNEKVARARRHCRRTLERNWASDIVAFVYWRCMARDGILFERPVPVDYWSAAFLASIDVAWISQNLKVCR